jgi:hypothetical protein
MAKAYDVPIPGEFGVTGIERKDSDSQISRLENHQHCKFEALVGKADWGLRSTGKKCPLTISHG